MLKNGSAVSVKATPNHFRKRPVRKIWIRTVSVFTQISRLERKTVRSALVFSTAPARVLCWKYAQVEVLVYSMIAAASPNKYGERAICVMPDHIGPPIGSSAFGSLSVFPVKLLGKN